MTYISEYAFFGCSNLKNIEFAGKIQYIGSYAFDKCSNVKKITIGYNSSLVVSKNALTSLSKSISVYVIYDTGTFLDLTAKKSYKNKFFSVLVGSNQWIWYFSSQGE